MKLQNVRRIETHCNVRAKGQGSSEVTKLHGVWKAVYFSPALADWGQEEAVNESACARLESGASRCNKSQRAAEKTDARQAEQQRE